MKKYEPNKMSYCNVLYHQHNSLDTFFKNQESHQIWLPILSKFERIN